jgi:hypothetical protein
MFVLFFLLAAQSQAASNSAPMVETEVATGVFYYSETPAKNAHAGMEFAEDGLTFETQRDPRDVARDNADDEIRQGNVCLRQAKSDLHTAAKKFRVRSLCREIYSEELSAAVEKAALSKLHPDVFRCYAEAEAHEKEGFVTVTLSFRGQLATHSPVPKKFQRAGFPDEPIDWALPTHNLTAGSDFGWKGALKHGACNFDGSALDKIAERVRAERTNAAEWAKCREKESAARERLVRVQEQFRAYVPDEWVVKSDLGSLLKEPAPAAASRAECRNALKQVEDHLSELQKLSNRIADEHGITALREGNRTPASATTEGEE